MLNINAQAVDAEQVASMKAEIRRLETELSTVVSKHVDANNKLSQLEKENAKLKTVAPGAKPSGIWKILALIFLLTTGGALLMWYNSKDASSETIVVDTISVTMDDGTNKAFSASDVKKLLNVKNSSLCIPIILHNLTSFRLYGMPVQFYLLYHPVKILIML